MVQTLLVLVGVAACFVFAPRQAGPGADWPAAGALFVLLPVAYFAWHAQMWPLALLLVCVAVQALWRWARWAWLR